MLSQFPDQKLEDSFQLSHIQTVADAKEKLKLIFSDQQGRGSTLDQINSLLTIALATDHFSIPHFYIIAALLATDFKKNVLKILQEKKSESSISILILLTFGFPSSFGSNLKYFFTYFKENHELVLKIMNEGKLLTYFDLPMRMKFAARRIEKPFSEMNPEMLTRLLSFPDHLKQFGEISHMDFKKEEIIKIFSTLPVSKKETDVPKQLLHNHTNEDVSTTVDKIWNNLRIKIPEECKLKKYEGKFQYTIEFLLQEGATYLESDFFMWAEEKFATIFVKRCAKLFLSDSSLNMKKLCEDRARKMTVTQLACLENSDQSSQLICLWNIIMVQLQNNEENLILKSITIHIINIIYAIDKNDFKSAIEFSISCMNNYSVCSVNIHLANLLKISDAPYAPPLTIFEWATKHIQYGQKSILTNLKKDCNEFFKSLFKNAMAIKTFKEIFNQGIGSHHLIKLGSTIDILFPKPPGAIRYLTIHNHLSSEKKPLNTNIMAGNSYYRPI